MRSKTGSILLFICTAAFLSGFFFRSIVKIQSDYEADLLRVSRFTGSFTDLAKMFSGMARSQGALYAYDVLRKAKLPPRIDIHLLGHAIGDELFIQKGARGIWDCTQEFRNACSHSIVVGLFMKDGEQSLGQIADICRNAPGGSGAYAMCFHGLGHGILSATGYDLENAVILCKKTSTPEKNNREGGECVGGAIMEIITGGFHDRDLWQKQSKKYLTTSDPLYPCSAGFMTPDIQGMCYVYLTPHLLLRAGGSLADPRDESWSEAMKYCELLHDGDPNKGICYGGFGKEFILIALGKDIRKINDMNDVQLGILYSLCTLALNTFGVNECVRSAVNSLYWGGENDYHVGLRFCQGISQSDTKTVCFENLTGAVFYYSTSETLERTFCKDIPVEYTDICMKKLPKN
ncbi:hypothetical protein HY947_00335 [Candidatus Gottesmanbacteria bacterium]|nr:hypothetical protein [Candidatus Gottesmanbacteria bacterium]